MDKNKTDRLAVTVAEAADIEAIKANIAVSFAYYEAYRAARAANQSFEEARKTASDALDAAGKAGGDEI